MTIRIPAEYDGRILRSYLKLTLGLSTAVLAKLKNHEQGILVNGRRVTVRYILREGDVLELFDRDTEATASETVIPCEHPLDILYEDDFVIALNKSAGMPTHPSHGHLTDTLGNALAFRYAAASEPFVFRPLGRLDRNTSGVVVAGKTRAASGCLGRSLVRGEVTKRYVALVVGEMPMDGLVHTVDAPMYRIEEPCEGGFSSIKRAVGDPEADGAVRALTRYRVLAAGGGHSLVLCEPVTGRTHQLRVHLSYLGYPILGDDLCGMRGWDGSQYPHSRWLSPRMGPSARRYGEYRQRPVSSQRGIDPLPYGGSASRSDSLRALTPLYASPPSPPRKDVTSP